MIKEQAARLPFAGSAGNEKEIPIPVEVAPIGVKGIVPFALNPDSEIGNI
jgi:hypothetical protein